MNEIEKFYYNKIKTKDMPEFNDLDIEQKNDLTRLYLMNPYNEIF